MQSNLNSKVLHSSKPLTLIQPSRGWVSLQLSEILRYRELLYFLVWRDIMVRYKQTIIGASWAILQPLLTMGIFTIVFGNFAKIPSDGIPYPVFSFVALVPWSFFAGGLTRASNSLVGSSALITKIYFPRLVIPIASVLAGLVDFALTFIVLMILLLIYGIVPTVNVIWLPAFLLLALITALGAGLWLTAMNVQFRDVSYVIPFLTQFLMYASPIVYPASIIQNPTLRVLFQLNPMSGVIEGFRWALLGTKDAPDPLILLSALIALAILISGAYYFRRMEKTFADVV